MPEIPLNQKLDIYTDTQKMIDETEPRKDYKIDLKKFSELDAWCEATGWKSQFRQIEPGELEVELETYFGKRTQLHRIYLNKRFHQRGAAPKKLLHFAIPYSKGRLVWRCSEVATESLLNHNAPEGFDAVSDSGFSAFIISLEQELVQDLAHALELDVRPETFTTDDAVYTMDSDQVPILRHRLQQFFTTIQKHPLSRDSISAVEEIESNLPAQLLHVLATPVKSHSGASARIRGNGLKRALQHIDQHAREALTVQKLCEASATSWRTLERAFRDHFEITPKAYLKSVRLNGVRGELLKSDPHEKVIDIANRWGFWHPGQFAADYRKYFGELPKATLTK